MTDDLVAWLRAQLDEDERVARAAGSRMPPTWNPPERERLDLDRGDYALSAGRGYEMEVFGQVWDVRDGPVVAHIARHDPARVLRDVAAMRAIVDAYEHKAESMARYPNQGNANGLFSLTVVIQHLAAVYAPRPGFRAEWAPEEANYD